MFWVRCSSCSRYKRRSSIGLENGDFTFFGGSGEQTIKLCFDQVLSHNVEPKPKKKQIYKSKAKNPRGPRPELAPIDPEFKAIVEGLDDHHRIDWPNNQHFDNGLKHLANQYADNVVTNFTTHSGKKITEFLKLQMFRWNTNGANVLKFMPNDIDCVVKLIMKQKVIKEYAGDPFKLVRCSLLYDAVNALNAFPEINLHDLLTNKANWFKAMPMFLFMQREIEAYNLMRANEHQPRRKKRKRSRKKKEKKKIHKLKRKQMLDDVSYPPCIRNLVVVPMCSFRRTHFKIDCSSMYTVLSSQGLIPKEKTEKGGEKNIAQKDFNAQKDQMWNRCFYMRKIRRFVRCKKNFDFSINTDGISVSLQYSTKQKKKTSEGINASEIIEKLASRKINRLAGIDPGMKSWNTTTVHDIDECKEVCLLSHEYIV